MAAYPVLVLQNAPAEGLGLFERALHARGHKWRTLEMWNGDRVPSTVSGYSHLVVLGGPQAAYHAEHVPYLADELRAIREAHATRTPILGVCLGSQLLAHALGGRAFKGPAPEIEVSPVARTGTGRADKLLRHVPDDLPVAHWHGDTFDLPPGAALLASTARYPQAFALPHDAYGLQFHLEWDARILAEVARADADDLAAAGVRVDDLVARIEREAPRLAAAAERLFDTFLEDCGCHD